MDHANPEQGRPSQEKNTRISNLSMVAHTCNSSTWDAEEGGSLVQDYHGLHSKTPVSKQNKIKNIK
jgi:hypothetical protein